MKIVEPSYEVYWPTRSGVEMLMIIERAGRTAYKSEEKIGPGSAVRFVKMLLDRGHYSPLEHVSVSARIVCDRGISHELVRHRLAAYTQESTRFCNYSADRFGKEIAVIRPNGIEEPQVVVGDRVSVDLAWSIWSQAVKEAEEAYFALLEAKLPPEIARSVLPTCLKTEIVATFNLREWRHVFKMRASPPAHPDMVKIMAPMLSEFREHVPVIFDTLEEK